MNVSPPPKKAGFALPAVLVVVGVVTLVFLVAITSLQSLGEQTRQVVDEVRFEQAALDAEARTAFLASTQPLTATALMADAGRATGGLGADRARAPDRIELDGRPYAMTEAPRLLVSVQDEAGLVNLDGLDRRGAYRLFDALAVPVQQREIMADRLADYVDPDDLKRADGAEAADYARAGLGPPPNGPLRRLVQVLGVLGWTPAVSPEAWAGLRDALTADPTSVSLNVNTAPPAALTVLFGLTDAQAQAAIARRAQAPFTTLEDFGRAAGVALVGDSERVYTFPSSRFAVKIVSPSAGLVARSRIVLSPRDPERPVWIEERSLSILSKQEKAAQPAHVPPFPRPAA